MAEAGLRARLDQSRGLIVVELVLVGAIFTLDALAPQYVLLTKTLYLLVLACLSMLVRGRWWGSIGFRLDRNFAAWILIGVIAGALIEAQELYLTQPMLTKWIGPPDLSDFRDVAGNRGLLALALGLVWTVGTFGEEGVYRGWLTTRLAQLFGRSKVGWTLAVVVANLLFAVAHGYQNLTGVIEAGLDGLLFAGLYFATGRNLLAPMIAHGVQDTIDVLLIYTNTYPSPV